MKKCIQLLSSFLLCIQLVCSGGPAFATLTESMSIKSGARTVSYSIEITQEPEERRLGLMFRHDLADTSGMLFLFDASEAASMWMKNTYISLDMLFIDKQGTIIFIAQNTTPLSEVSVRPPDELIGKTRAVLELKAGQVAQEHIKVGDKIIHNLFNK